MKLYNLKRKVFPHYKLYKEGNRKIYLGSLTEVFPLGEFLGVLGAHLRYPRDLLSLVEIFAIQGCTCIPYYLRFHACQANHQLLVLLYYWSFYLFRGYQLADGSWSSTALNSSILNIWTDRAKSRFRSKTQSDTTNIYLMGVSWADYSTTKRRRAETNCQLKPIRLASMI